MRRQLLSLLLLSTASLAQVAMEGDVVLKTTGAPLPGVRVAASCPELHWTATDVAGHFSFPVVQASLPFCTLSLDGPRLLPRHQWVAIHPQDSHISVRVEMRPQAAIAGKVTDENGWPVAGATLTAAQYRTANGIRELQPVASARADDRGEYRFGKLVPGRYYVQVRPPGDVPGGDYLPTAAEDARAIDLKEGEEATGADIHLARGGGVAVSGRVVLPDGFQPVQASLRVYWENLVTTMGGPLFPIAPDGTFIARHLVPGTYVLTAAIGEPPNHAAAPRYLAVRTIKVSRDNIDGITLNMVETPIRELRGTVVFEGRGRPDPLHINLSRQLSQFSARSQVEPDGSFVIPGLWPGRYRLSAIAMGGQVTSIRFGDQEINRILCGGGSQCGEFDFDGTPAPLRVTVAKTVRISGTVSDAGAHPVARAGLIFVPSGGVYEPFPGNLLQAQTDENGAFTTIPLLPGVYRVFVIEDPADAEQTMADPDFLKSQEKTFPPLTVVAGENAPLKLALPSK
ncbi:MAG: carboxypeptidase regulatory-like domain-containing protein [Bryobacteraceae bacterium]|jgi:hypothetical protein